MNAHVIDLAELQLCRRTINAELELLLECHIPPEEIALVHRAINRSFYKFLHVPSN